MELVPAALETRCLILLPAAPGLAPAVLDYYLRNAAFLAPFEPERPAGFYTAEHHARELAADVQRAAQGTGVRFYLALKDVPGRVIGSVALNNIVRGAFQSCFLGYKLDGALCGRGYMTQAVEACTRFAFGPAALHRVEANVMPRNTASLRVLENAATAPKGWRAATCASTACGRTTSIWCVSTSRARADIPRSIQAYAPVCGRAGRALVLEFRQIVAVEHRKKLPEILYQRISVQRVPLHPHHLALLR